MSTRVLLTTSNGSGMGHLSRQVCVATALGARADTTLMSMSTSVPVALREGLRAEYCPSHHRGWMPHALWHGYLAERIRALVEETQAQVLVFDGVVPYLGLLRARADLPGTAFVWMRRGMWRPGLNEAALRARPFFDAVVEPGDLAAAADRGATAALGDAVRVSPVSMVEHEAGTSREAAAAALGLDPDRPTALVMLSDPALAAAAVQALLADPERQVAVTRTPIAPAGGAPPRSERVVELHGVYPLARYLPAVDLAVAAAGYNGFHELLLSGVPTLLVPRERDTDDQEARAGWAVHAGLALRAPEDPAQVAAQATRLLDPRQREALARACARLDRPRGSAQTAEELLGLVAGFGSHRPGPRERLLAAELAAREAAMRALGARGTAAVRAALRRPPPSGPAHRLTVRPVEEAPGAAATTPTAGALLLTERCDAALVAGDEPLEHLLPGSSRRYRSRRRALVRRSYRLDGAPGRGRPPEV